MRGFPDELQVLLINTEKNDHSANSEVVLKSVWTARSHPEVILFVKL